MLPFIGRNVSVSFASFCPRTISPLYTIFNKKHSIADLNNLCKFHSIRRQFTNIRARTGRQTDKSNALTIINVIGKC